ncbi:MAG: hypothetical protein MUO76_10595 [Anaerolineaceae bacterium]|nr:hypothetical protein [Anaerolineaceae bacterium]
MTANNNDWVCTGHTLDLRIINLMIDITYTQTMKMTAIGNYFLCASGWLEDTGACVAVGVGLVWEDVVVSAITVPVSGAAASVGSCSSAAGASSVGSLIPATRLAIPV